MNSLVVLCEMPVPPSRPRASNEIICVRPNQARLLSSRYRALHPGDPALRVVGDASGHVRPSRPGDPVSIGEIMMEIPPILLMKDGRREMIPIDKIKVINSRTR